MPFAEPRPHRRYFREWNGGFAPLVLTPNQPRGNIAVTSLTLANQGTTARFIDVLARVPTETSGGTMLMMVWLPGRSTLHLPFPHPLMAGPDFFLVVDTHVKNKKGPMIPVTAVGYEWVSTDDKTS